MTNKDRIESAIRHIQTAVDIDPWTQGLAVEALKAQLSGEGTTSDCISRQAAIDALEKHEVELPIYAPRETDVFWNDAIDCCVSEIEGLPSAQPERDTPKKPNEATDRSWGIPNKQPVCPKCDCYLGTVHFLCEGDKRKVTYCESCGQAIDWEGWKNDEGD